MLLTVVWANRFLPMQDLPHHVLMAWVANHYTDSALNLAANYELRGQLGPYRATYFLQRLFEAVVGPLLAAKLVVSVYLLLMGWLVLRVQRALAPGNMAWATILLLPISFNAVYFFGFLNFTFSVPLLVLALFGLRDALARSFSGTSYLRQALWVLVLFMVHPYTLLVYIVLAGVTVLLLADSAQRMAAGISSCVMGIALILAWLVWSGSADGAAGRSSFALPATAWWPPELNRQFLAMQFAGMRISSNPNLVAALLWGLAVLISIAGFWPRRSDYRSGVWLPLLGLIALAGFFVLPFSIQTDARYTFFNTRLAVIAQFLLVLILATLPLVPFAGRALVAVGLALTLVSVQLHYRVAAEIDEIVPVFDDMDTGARVLPLIRGASSAYLDRRFYGQFLYGTVYYYPVLREGGTVPGLFNNSLMPVGFKPGREPPGVSMRQLSRLSGYLGHYDYIIARNLPPQLLSQLGRQLVFRLEAGPWRLYEVQAGELSK